jgi:multiple antibiotic resistance protein
VRELALNPFVTLLVVVDPLGLAPIFAAPTKGYSEKRKREAAIRGTVLGAAILLIFALAGDALLRALRISTPAFRIAGGILLFLLALDMIFASPSGSRSETVRQQEKESYQQDISVCPLATPCSPGPARSRPSSSTPASGAPRSWRCSWPYYSWFCSHLVLPLPRPLRIT